MWVDADGCPRAVVDICLKLGKRYSVPVVTVANYHHQFTHEHHLQVSDESQAVDLAILNRLRKGDIVVSQDQGLAALVLGKGGYAISVSGHVYDSDEIQMLLELRAEAARFRRGGGRTKGPKKRIASEDQFFEQSLTQLLEKGASYE